MFADEPNLIAGQMLLALASDPPLWPVGDPHAHRGEARLEFPFGAKAPADPMPSSLPQHVFGRSRYDVWNRRTRASAPNSRPDHLHIGRVDFEMAGNSDGPAQFAIREPLAERGALAIAGIRQHAAKAHAGCNAATAFFQRDFPLRAWLSIGLRN